MQLLISLYNDDTLTIHIAIYGATRHRHVRVRVGFVMLDIRLVGSVFSFFLNSTVAMWHVQTSVCKRHVENRV